MTIITTRTIKRRRTALDCLGCRLPAFCPLKAEENKTQQQDEFLFIVQCPTDRPTAQSPGGGAKQKKRRKKKTGFYYWEEKKRGEQRTDDEDAFDVFTLLLLTRCNAPSVNNNTKVNALLKRRRRTDGVKRRWNTLLTKPSRASKDAGSSLSINHFLLFYSMGKMIAATNGNIIAVVEFLKVIDSNLRIWLQSWLGDW